MAFNITGITAICATVIFYKNMYFFYILGRSLLVFPGMSNFCGFKYPMTSVIDKFKSKGYSIMLDASALVSTCPLDLKNVKPDFACLSFYKLFG